MAAGIADAVSRRRAATSARGLAALLVALWACASGAGAGTAASAEAIRGRAVIEIPADAFTDIVARQTLRVTELRFRRGSPVVEGEPLVTLDTVRLERELDAKTREFRELQASRRSIGPGRGFGVATDSTRVAELQQEILETQSKLTTADVLAPADGYLGQYLVNAGGTARRKKPVARFAELSRARLEVVVSLSAAAILATARAVQVVDPADGRRAFRAEVTGRRVGDDGAPRLVLSPCDVPFLFLGIEAEVELRPVP